jgi:hypothetical protein
MPDSTIGFLILGTVIVLVLAIVFAVTMRGYAPRPRPTPPPGVHLPPGSMLPVVLSVGAALLGAGLTFKPDDPYPIVVLDVLSKIFNPFLAVPGIVVLLYGIWSWVRAANREWRETEAGGSHHDAPEH